LGNKESTGDVTKGKKKKGRPLGDVERQVGEKRCFTWWKNEQKPQKTGKWGWGKGKKKVSSRGQQPTWWRSSILGRGKIKTTEEKGRKRSWEIAVLVR